MVDYKIVAGTVGTLLVLALVVSSGPYARDYRQILAENPGTNNFILDISEERLEFLAREPVEGIEFVRFRFDPENRIRMYHGSDLVADSYIKIFDGSRQVVFREEQAINYTPIYHLVTDETDCGYDENELGLVANCDVEEDRILQSAEIIQKVDYFTDSLHTNYVGQLVQKTEVYPQYGKITWEWYPKDMDNSYCMRWEVQTDEEDDGIVLKSASDPVASSYGITDTKGVVVDVSDAADKLVRFERFKNGKARAMFSCQKGVQVIDPFVGSTQEDKQANSQARICSDGNCAVNDSLVFMANFEQPDPVNDATNGYVVTENIAQPGAGYFYSTERNSTYFNGSGVSAGGCGNEDYWKIGTDTDYSTLCLDGCTITAWVNHAEAAFDMVVARRDTTGSNEFFRMGVTSGGSLEVDFWDDGGTNNCAVTAGSMNLNQWYHIAMFWNSTDLLCGGYVDGDLVGVDDVAWNISAVDWADNEDTFIGSQDDGSCINNWGGGIDAVRLYNRTLGSEEINATMLADHPIASTDNVLSTEFFDDGSSGNETYWYSNGTLVGVNVSTYTPQESDIGNVIYANISSCAAGSCETVFSNSFRIVAGTPTNESTDYCLVNSDLEASGLSEECVDLTVSNNALYILDSTYILVTGTVTIDSGSTLEIREGSIVEVRS